MNVKTRRLTRGLLIGSGAVVALVAIAASLLYALLRFGVVPLSEGEQLADGAITTVITDWMGPIAIGAYIFELGDGNVGLVDAGMDPNATAVLEALRRMRRTADDVRAILFTHEHNDHISGARAFPRADVYAHESFADRLEMSRSQNPIVTGATRRVRDGDQLEVFETSVEIFSIPGHTRGSVAIFVHGVLFLGDSAGSISDGTMQPNTLLVEDAERNILSLLELAKRLEPRRSEIGHLAFGHQGPLHGLDPLLKWASAARTAE